MFLSAIVRLPFSRLSRSLTAVLLISLIQAAPIAFAQSDLATVFGRVTDQSGAVIVGAEVEIRNVETNIPATSTSNDSGLYTIPSLRPGHYVVSVRKPGFKTVSVTQLELNVQDNVARNFVLQVGSASESITVTADALNMNTTDATVSTVVDRRFVENLPLNGRSFQQLITLTPGVVLTRPLVGNEGQFSVNGQRSISNYFTVDGVSANFGTPTSAATGVSAGGSLPAFTSFGGTNSLVSVDAMQEFRVQTSTYAPEFGRQLGGQISIATRSGTNEFHGTLFEYFRNDKLDANDWFANRNGLPKPPLRQNDFGGVLGGPIIKNRTFFFFSYEGLRLRQPQVRMISVPSTDSRQAAIPAMRPFFDAFPIPNGPDLGTGFAQFSASFSDEVTLNATSIRIDHTFNNKWTIFGRLSHALSENLTHDAGVSTVRPSAQKIQALTLGTTQLFTPNLSNEFRLNVSRARGSDAFDLTDFGGAVPADDSLLFPSPLSSSDGVFVFQILGVTGSSWGTGAFGFSRQRQINLVDNISATKGAHHLKFGVDYRRLAPVAGTSRYLQSALFGNLASAQAGTATSVFIRSGEPVASVATNFSAYAQDTWRITPRFTLTYGLRWDVNPAPHGKDGNELFSVTGVNDPPTISLKPSGVPLYDTTYSNVAPRIGVAYQISQKPGMETILRGGFGRFYDLGTARLAGTLSAFFPYVAQKILIGVPYPLSPTNAEPPPQPDISSPVGATSGGFEPDFRPPRTYQWNAALEQSLGGNQTVSISYIGALGRDLLTLNVLSSFGNPSFSQVWVARSSATSDYHALQVQFKRRLSRGLQALASYTWSHSIDIASQDANAIPPPAFVDPQVNRGSSDFDVRHSLSTAASYDLPGPAVGPVRRALLRDWGIDTIFTARSSTPLDLVGRINVVGFQAGLRPDLVPGLPLWIDDPSAAGGRRLNRAAFAVPPPGRQGTFGRNVLRGFPLWQLDFAVRRQFHLGERLNLQFRADFFNIFNHPNFANTQAVLANPLFGQSTEMLNRGLGGPVGVSGVGFNPLYQVGGPRSIQLALKLVY